jgi:adenosylmethionine-8-amino-7-oxononanoate aminotransferase
VSPPLILSKTDCETIVDVLDDAISAATHTLQN